MKYGNREVKHGLFLGPMAGVTDTVYRELCQNQGCEVTYTEMVSAKAIHYNNKKTETLLAIGENEFSALVFGSFVHPLFPLWPAISFLCVVVLLKKSNLLYHQLHLSLSWYYIDKYFNKMFVFNNVLFNTIYLLQYEVIM